MDKGNILILNGVSSAGKTTLAKCLQEIAPDQYFLFSADLLNDISSQKGSRSYSLRFSADPVPVMSAFYGCVKAFSDRGLHTIVDTIFTTDESFALSTFMDVFPDNDYPVSFVHVTCPVDELRRREAERGDRKPGWGESLLPKLDPQDTYDLTVDTHRETISACADAILAYMAKTEKPMAFHTLWTQRKNQAKSLS